MAGLSIRLYYITIEGSDAAGNIGRDQCRVIIIPRNMKIQQADAIVQKSSVRYPIAATTDVGRGNNVGSQDKHHFGVYPRLEPSII